MVKDFVRWGAGPRAGQAMILAAKASALLAGQFSVTPDDLKSMVLPVLRHRILINFRAEAEGITSEDIALHLADKMMASNHKRV
jgi:MoxR-like ATPase